MGFPAIYSGPYTSGPSRKRRSGGKSSLTKKISKLRRLLEKLRREIEREAMKKKDRDEINRLEKAVANSRETLSKMRGRRY